MYAGGGQELKCNLEWPNECIVGGDDPSLHFVLIS